MAQIDIQKKEGPPTWVWIAGVIALLLVAGVVWALVTNDGDRDDTRMHQDTLPEEQGTIPRSGLDQPDVIAASVVFAAQPVRIG